MRIPSHERQTWCGPGKLIEMYGYSISGLVTKKRLRLNWGGSNADLNGVWSYDIEGKMTSMAYPLGPTLRSYTWFRDRLVNILRAACVLKQVTATRGRDCIPFHSKKLGCLLLPQVRSVVRVPLRPPHWIRCPAHA